jgi:hypothetical protein
MNRNLKAEIIRRFGNQANFSHALSEHTTIISAVLHGKMKLDEKRRQAWTELLGAEAMGYLEDKDND